MVVSFKVGKKSIKKEDTVQCHQHWSHPSCVGENHKDIIRKWSCPTCHTMPDVLGMMFNLLCEIQQENTQLRLTLTESLAKIQRNQDQTDQIQDLSITLNKKTTELSEATKEILRGSIAGLDRKMNQKSWKSFRSEEKERTLLVGSSLVGDIKQSHLVNTDVVCIPGGKISENCVSGRNRYVYETEICPDRSHSKMK